DWEEEFRWPHAPARAGDISLALGGRWHRPAPGEVLGAPAANLRDSYRDTNVGERIGSVPGFRQVAMQIHLRITGQEGGGDQAVEALRLAVGGEAWVEIDGSGFDDKSERRRIEFCGMRTAGKEKEFSTEGPEDTDTEGRDLEAVSAAGHRRFFRGW